MRPSVAGPNSVKTYNSADALAQRRIAVNKAYLVSCVNSRADDIALAAQVVRGRKVAEVSSRSLPGSTRCWGFFHLHVSVFALRLRSILCLCIVEVCASVCERERESGCVDALVYL